MTTLVRDAVDSYFAGRADYWDEIYDQSGLVPLIYQARLDRALASIRSMQLAVGSPVLEVGCGTGRLAVPMAERGLQVIATDTVAAMRTATMRRAERAGVQRNLSTVDADVLRLPFADESFLLVIALGVLPWVASGPKALSEMARVVAPGGFLLVTSDNVLALHRWVDPLRNPVLSPIWRGLRSWIGRTGILSRYSGPPVPRLELPTSIDRMLIRLGLELVSSRTVGFGPFTFCSRDLLSDETAIRLNGSLERLGAARAIGGQYVVVAQKSPPSRSASSPMSAGT